MPNGGNDLVHLLLISVLNTFYYLKNGAKPAELFILLMQTTYA